jgi:hypothetical protein
MTPFFLILKNLLPKVFVEKKREQLKEEIFVLPSDDHLPKKRSTTPTTKYRKRKPRRCFPL